MSADAAGQQDGSDQPQEEQPTGVVRQDGVHLEGDVQWFHTQKGFGFLNNISDGGDAVYVHYKDIVGFPCLLPNTRVQFVFNNNPEGHTKKGRATDVRRVGGEEIKCHGSLRSEKSRQRLAANPEIKLGVCKWFDPNKGYGFITPEGGGDDVFAHYKVFSVLPVPGMDKVNIPQGMELEYQVTQEEGKDKAKCTTVTAPGGGPINPLGPLTPPMPYLAGFPLSFPRGGNKRPSMLGGPPPPMGFGGPFPRPPFPFVPGMKRGRFER